MRFLQNQRVRIKREYLSYYELDGRYDEAYLTVIQYKEYDDDYDDSDDMVWICYSEVE